MAKVSPIFKNGKKVILTNYGPISFLLCFSKALERIVYDRLHTYFTDNKMIFKDSLVFQLVILSIMHF